MAVTCPTCGSENSLSRKFDAWASFEITGVDAKGELILSDDCDTQIFDDNQIECSECDEQFDEDAVTTHLANHAESEDAE